MCIATTENDCFLVFYCTNTILATGEFLVFQKHVKVTEKVVLHTSITNYIEHWTML